MGRIYEPCTASSCRNNTHDLELAVAPLPIAEKHDENAWLCAWHLFCVSEPRSAMSFAKCRPTAASKSGDHMCTAWNFTVIRGARLEKRRGNSSEDERGAHLFESETELHVPDPVTRSNLRSAPAPQRSTTPRNVCFRLTPATILQQTLATRPLTIPYDRASFLPFFPSQFTVQKITFCPVLCGTGHPIIPAHGTVYLHRRRSRPRQGAVAPIRPQSRARGCADRCRNRHPDSQVH